MFDNIGRKIKGLASAVTWIGIILSIISGISMLSSSGGLLAIPAILVMALGSLFSWLASLTLYGFGQLIENSDILVSKNFGSTSEENEPHTAYQTPRTSNELSAPYQKIAAERRALGLCQHCGGQFHDKSSKCTNCGLKRDY